MDDDNAQDVSELVERLLAAKDAIDAALEQLGASEPEVSGFQATNPRPKLPPRNPFPTNFYCPKL